jgi:hypothetical protein
MAKAASTTEPEDNQVAAPDTGDGGFQTFESDGSAPTEPVKPEGGTGKTLVRTLHGYAHDSGIDGIPLVTSVGVLVTAKQAEEIAKSAEATATVILINPGSE